MMEAKPEGRGFRARVGRGISRLREMQERQAAGARMAAIRRQRMQQEQLARMRQENLLLKERRALERERRPEVEEPGLRRKRRSSGFSIFGDDDEGDGEGGFSIF